MERKQPDESQREKDTMARSGSLKRKKEKAKKKKSREKKIKEDVPDLETETPSQQDMDNAINFALEANDHACDLNYYAAASLLTRSIALDPLDDGYYLNRSFFYAEMNEFQMALDDAEKALTIEVSSIGFFRKGEALLHLRRFKEAEQAFLTALSIGPDEPDESDCEAGQLELHKARALQVMAKGYCRDEAIAATANDSAVDEALNKLQTGSVAVPIDQVNIFEDDNVDVLFADFQMKAQVQQNDMEQACNKETVKSGKHEMEAKDNMGYKNSMDQKIRAEQANVAKPEKPEIGSGSDISSSSPGFRCIKYESPSKEFLAFEKSIDRYLRTDAAEQVHKKLIKTGGIDDLTASLHERLCETGFKLEVMKTLRAFVEVSKKRVTFQDLYSIVENVSSDHIPAMVQHEMLRKIKHYYMKEMEGEDSEEDNEEDKDITEDNDKGDNEDNVEEDITDYDMEQVIEGGSKLKI